MNMTTLQCLVAEQQQELIRLQNLLSSFKTLLAKARSLKWSATFLHEQHDKVLKGNDILTSAGQWEKLALTDKYRMYGYWDALTDILIGEMQFKYLINDKWYTPDEMIEHKDEIDSKDMGTNGHYVYPDNTIYC